MKCAEGNLVEKGCGTCMKGKGTKEGRELREGVSAIHHRHNPTLRRTLQKGLIDVTLGESSQNSVQFHVSIFINLLRFRKSARE